jgi:hypothetical protein
MSSAIDEALAGQVRAALEYKVFQGSGSKGFHCQGEITAAGARYQASAQAVLIGSKKDPRMQVRASAGQVKDALTDLIRAGLPPKVFQSGKKGYYASGALPVRAESYQAQVQAVLLAAR